MKEIRCPEGILFGLLPADTVLEVKCRSRRCGAGPGVVVLHRFAIPGGALIETRRYRDPEQREKVKDQDGTE
jgi:hypothetical protein